MAIDRIDWHSGGDFPDDMPEENGGTHIGMYLAWIINNDLHGEVHRGAGSSEAVRKLKRREITGLDFLVEQCDTKFWEADLNDEGKAFTDHYYSNDQTAKYVDDYAETLAKGLPTVYHVQNTWENYDKLAKVIDKRYKEWRSMGRKKWWQF